MSGTPSLPVYIMAGGKSSRFGSDKARALLHEKPLLLHVVDALAPQASHLFVVAERSDAYSDLGITTLSDLSPHLGPMGGLQTALEHHRQAVLSSPHEEGWFLFVSCDMMGLQSTWIDTLWQGRQPSKQAVAFGPDPWDALFALYHTDIITEVNQRIEQGQRAMWRLLDATAQALPHPQGWNEVVSINTQDALHLYAARTSRTDGDS